MSSAMRLKSWVSACRCHRAGVSVAVTMFALLFQTPAFGLAACSARLRHDDVACAR